MEYFAGIDVSLEQSSVCVVNSRGKIVREAKVASEPEALAEYLGGLGLALARVGLEAGPLSQWLHAGLRAAGFDAVLLETRHVKAALSAMIVKTDRKDARGIAQLLRMGWFRTVHAKTPAAQEIRALLGIGPSMTNGAVIPSQCKPARKVMIFQCPCGTGATSRNPRAARPQRRVMLVRAQVSPMKISRLGSRAGWRRMNRRRAAATSGRSCSAACRLF
jgi:Transposase